MISLIAAVAKNLAIGKDGQLLWHLPEDMRYFRETTRGKPVIMGRKTWESLPDVFRPLPGRRNIVISRNPAYDAPGATLAGSLEEAVRLAQDDAEVFVIGGAEIYRQALPLAQPPHRPLSHSAFWRLHAQQLRNHLPEHRLMAHDENRAPGVGPLGQIEQVLRGATWQQFCTHFEFTA